jgi:hypothetical protein
MRDLLNLIDNIALPLIEGVGLSNRKPGERFKNSVEDIVTFQGLEFHPQSGAYPADQLKDAVAQVAQQMNIGIEQIHWTNAEPSGGAGFGIAAFTGEDGNTYYLGRYFKNVSPNRTQNNFPHDAIPGGFKYQSKAGQKENSGLKPSEWLTQFQNNTPQTILDQAIAKFGQNSAEANALETFINGDIPVEVAKGNMNPSAFRDYFAEVLQPIALVMGKKVTGNAAEAASIFFGPGSDFSDCTISFNSNTIGGLYDSLLVNPEGKQIKLSSKGKDGASASVTNLQKSVQELANVPAGKKLLTTYKNEVDILNTIEKNGHFGAPLKLAVQYGMITPQEATQVLSLKNKGPNDQIIGSGILSKKLEGMYEGRKAKDASRIIPIEHLTAAIAYRVADHVNKNTNFGSAAANILNNAALVQMYTDTSDGKDTITVTKLTAVYPSQTVTGVLLDASKVYFSTGGKGNYTFTILKNGAKSKDVSPMDGIDSIEQQPQPQFGQTSTADLDAEIEKPRLTGPGAKAARATNTPKTDVATLGREKRR